MKWNCDHGLGISPGHKPDEGIGMAVQGLSSTTGEHVSQSLRKLHAKRGVSTCTSANIKGNRRTENDGGPLANGSN